MTRERIAYDAPGTLYGLLGRFYPLIVPLLSIAIGTEIGGILAHGAATLGHPKVPYLYNPIDGFKWFAGSAVDPGNKQLLLAAEGFGYSVLAICMLTFGQMLIDFAHGRSWGPLNFLFYAVTMVGDLETLFKGYPPSFTWWGTGGVMDRTVGSRARKPPAR
jgi:hypothetical protein